MVDDPSLIYSDVVSSAHACQPNNGGWRWFSVYTRINDGLEGTVAGTYPSPNGTSLVLLLTETAAGENWEGKYLAQGKYVGEKTRKGKCLREKTRKGKCLGEKTRKGKCLGEETRKGKCFGRETQKG